jgi:hypothetical protein
MKSLIILCFLINLLECNEIQGQKSLAIVWSDEFDYKGMPDSKKWIPTVAGNGFGNNELQCMKPNRFLQITTDENFSAWNYFLSGTRYIYGVVAINRWRLLGTSGAW